MKMYILIRDSIPQGIALLAAARASLACYLKFKDTPEVKEWISGPFYKTVMSLTTGKRPVVKIQLSGIGSISERKSLIAIQRP